MTDKKNKHPLNNNNQTDGHCGWQQEKAHFEELLAKKADLIDSLELILHEKRERIEELELEKDYLKRKIQKEREKRIRLASEFDKQKKVLQKKEADLARINEAYINKVKDLEILTGYLNSLQKSAAILLQSKRWKTGNTIGEFLRKILFRPVVPMPAKLIETTFKKYASWKKADKL